MVAIGDVPTVKTVVTSQQSTKAIVKVKRTLRVALWEKNDHPSAWQQRRVNVALYCTPKLKKHCNGSNLHTTGKLMLSQNYHPN